MTTINYRTYTDTNTSVEVDKDDYVSVIAVSMGASSKLRLRLVNVIEDMYTKRRTYRIDNTNGFEFTITDVYGV